MSGFEDSEFFGTALIFDWVLGQKIYSTQVFA